MNTGQQNGWWHEIARTAERLLQPLLTMMTSTGEGRLPEWDR
jgi:hypothetical protein